MKKIILLAVACITFAGANAQVFQHGAGVGIYFDKIKDFNARTSIAIAYNPRINFAETASRCFSIGVPISAGFSGDYKATYGIYDKNRSSHTVGYMISAPIVLSLNFGGGSSKQNKKRFGGFVGAGYGYYRTNKVHYAFNTEDNNQIVLMLGSSTMGATANTGVRIGTGKDNKENLEFRVSYYRGTANYRNDVYGLVTAYNF